MEDEIIDFSQKNFVKSSDLEQDKISQSIIPPNSTETNNSNVFSSSFEELLAQTNLNKTFPIKPKDIKKKK